MIIEDTLKIKHLSQPTGFHFNQPGHDISDMTVIVLQKVKNDNKFAVLLGVYATVTLHFHDHQRPQWVHAVEKCLSDMQRDS